MFRLIQTNRENTDFINLVNALDADLAVRDGADHAFYAQFNKITGIPYVIVAYAGEKPVGCGALKPFDEENLEVKRMYVIPEFRGKGVAAQILEALENWAAKLNYNRCVLETGEKQPEAIALYKKNGYQRIENYGQYQGVANSLCFAKTVSKNNK